MAPASGVVLRGKPRRPNSGPLPTTQVREASRKRWRPDASVILAELAMDVVATLHVLVEIEFSRREGLVTKATPNLDVVRPSPDDAVVK